tara:strand:- start:3143 stop:4063 length:921 start_codon:yes stop_codon:yes gene_type:complete
MKNNISRLIYGTGGPFGYQSMSQAKKIIDFALSKGIRKFDTGSNYASFKAEKLLGECLKNTNYPKESIEIYTKFGTIYSRRKGKLIKDFSVSNCLYTLDNSINNLCRTKIDCYYMHEPSSSYNINKSCCKELERLKEVGKIRNWGILAHNYKLIESINKEWKIFPDYIMLKLNLGNYFKQKENIKELRKKGIKIIAGTVLGQGALLNNRKKKILFRNELFYFLRKFLKKESSNDYKRNIIITKAIENNSSILASFAAVAFILNLNEIDSISFSSLREKGIQEIIDMSSISFTKEQYNFIYNLISNI